METGGEKSAFCEKMEAQLKEWGIHLDEMGAKASKATSDARVECERMIQSLRNRLIMARGKLAELKESKGPAWESLRRGIEKAWSELKKGIDEAYKKLT